MGLVHQVAQPPDTEDPMNPVRSIIRRVAARQRNLLIGRADVARDARRWSEAAALYRKYLKRAPDDPDIWVQFGHMMKESGSLPAAEAAYRRALSLRSDFSDTHLMLGHALKLQARLPEALEAYRRANELDPADARSREEYERLSVQLAPSVVPAPTANDNQPDESAASRTPEDGYTSAVDIRLAGDRARDARDWPEAVSAYARYLHLCPDDAPIWVQYAHVLKETGRLEDADLAYARAEQLAPAVADAFVHHGHLLKKLGRTRDAAEAFRRAAQLDPNDIGSLREAEALQYLPRPPSSPDESHASAVTSPAAQPCPSCLAQLKSEEDVREMRERLTRTEESLQLMQGQARAIRVLTSELVKARQETSDLKERIRALEMANDEIGQVHAKWLAELDARPHLAHGPGAEHPFRLFEQHLAQRATRK